MKSTKDYAATMAVRRREVELRCFEEATADAYMKARREGHEDAIRTERRRIAKLISAIPTCTVGLSDTEWAEAYHLKELAEGLENQV